MEKWGPALPLSLRILLLLASRTKEENEHLCFIEFVCCSNITWYWRGSGDASYLEAKAQFLK